MVLAELGSKLAQAIHKMRESNVIDQEVIDEMLKEITHALLEADVNVRLIKQLRDNIQNMDMNEIAGGLNKRKIVHRAVLEELSKLIDPGVKPFQLRKGKSNVIMFVGLQGSGKTTTITKFSHYYQKKGWKCALICADTFRAGAFDQLKQNATRSRIPFYGSYTETDPVVLAQDGVDMFRKENYEIILIDTSGRHKQEDTLFEEMRQVASVVKPDEVVFVLDASIGQAAQDQATAFNNSVDVGSVIVTKMDGHAKGGGALSAVAATKSPIVFIGTGEHMDEFEPFDAKRFLRRLLGMGDIGGLIETMQEIGIDEQADLMMRMTQGIFNLRDLYDMFQNVLKMGPLNKVMSMIPGLGQDLIPKGKERESQARLKGFMTIMDSMTTDELDNNTIVGNHSRCERVAKGSGHSIKDVNELMTEFKRLGKMVKKIKKMGKGMGNFSGMKGMSMNQMSQQMGRIMDPRMLKQMGGASGIQNMMKGFQDTMGGDGDPFGGMQ